MKMTALLIFAFCISAHAQTNIPAVVAERWLKSETDTVQVWIDKMSDGSYREATVKKAPTVVRSRLIATNDVDFAWRFDYEAKLSDGTLTTNATFRAKPPKERINAKIAAMAKVTPHMPKTNDVDRIDLGMSAMKSQTSASLAKAVVVRRRAENNKPVSAINAGNGKLVLTYKDGRTETRDIKHIVSARRPSPYEKERKISYAIVGEQTTNGKLAATVEAAVLAAAAGYLAGKKGKG